MGSEAAELQQIGRPTLKLIGELRWSDAGEANRGGGQLQLFLSPHTPSPTWRCSTSPHPWILLLLAPPGRLALPTSSSCLKVVLRLRRFLNVSSYLAECPHLSAESLIILAVWLLISQSRPPVAPERQRRYLRHIRQIVSICETFFFCF